MDNPVELYSPWNPRALCHKIVEENCKKNSAAARKETRNGKGKVSGESTGSKVIPDWKTSSRASPDGVGFSGTCFAWNQRGHRQRDYPTGSKEGKETSPSRKWDSAAVFARATSRSQPRLVNVGGVAVAQCTRNQLAASCSSGERSERRSSSPGIKKTTLSWFRCRESGWLKERLGTAGKLAVGDVEIVVSQQAGPSLPPPETQSALILSQPNPEANDYGWCTSYVQQRAGGELTPTTSTNTTWNQD